VLKLKVASNHISALKSPAGARALAKWPGSYLLAATDNDFRAAFRSAASGPTQCAC
jgi:hypothetical protein